jgi:hypothetical protein
MKVMVYTSYGFSGTDDNYEEEIPEDIVEKGDSAIQEYLADLEEGIWQNMLDRLSLSIELIEDEEDVYEDDEE